MIMTGWVPLKHPLGANFLGDPEPRSHCPCEVSNQDILRSEKSLETAIFSILSSYLFQNGSVSKPCTPVVHIKIAGKWMFIPLKMVLIGIDPYPNQDQAYSSILRLIFPAFSSVSPFFSGTSGEVIPPPTKKKKQPTHPPSTSP